MEIVIKAAAVGLAIAVMAPLIKRGSPEISLALSIAAAAAIAALGMALGGRILETAGRAVKLSGLSPAVYAPVLKCVGIAVTAKLSSELCRDAGQSGAASAVELCGALSALCAALPLFAAFLEMVGSFI